MLWRLLRSVYTTRGRYEAPPFVRVYTHISLFPFVDCLSDVYNGGGNILVCNHCFCYLVIPFYFDPPPVFSFNHGLGGGVCLSDMPGRYRRCRPSHFYCR